MQTATSGTKQRAGALVVTVAALVAAVVVVFTAIGGRAEPASPAASGPPAFATPTRPPAASVVAYYELLDADGALLYERVLDGASLPRLIVERPSSDFSRTFTVDPTGQWSLAAFSAEGRTTLEAIEIASGETLWHVETPILEPESAIWSSDGRRWAALVAEVDFEAGPSVLIADIASGGTALVALDERAWPQGFTSTGRLVLTERDEDLMASVLWRFVTVDPTTGGIVRLATPPPVGPHSVYADDVDPAHGLGVAHFPVDDQQLGTTIQVRGLTSSDWRRLADFESIDRLLFDPSGEVIAANADGKTVLVDLAGRVTELWDGPDYADLAWSASGEYLGVSGWDEGSIIGVIERSTKRVVELPLPEGIAEGRLVSVVGRGPLPGIALPPGGDPAPSPSPEPVGPTVAGAPGVVVGWIERVDGVPIAHAEVRLPTDDGGIRTVATMPPIMFEDLANLEASLSVVPRPGGLEILVKVDSEGATNAWLWDPSAGRRPFPFPEGWPAAVGEIAWRPDGGAIASTTLGAEAGVDAEAVVVVAELDTSIVRQLPVPDGYSVLESWWSQDELRMGRDVCIEDCPGRYAYSVRMRVSDGRLHPFGPDDRPSVPIHAATVEFDPAPEITLSSINDETADDVRIGWPADLPPIDGSIVIWAPPEPDLLVGAPTPKGVSLYRIADPIGRSSDGRLDRPDPVLVATLPISAEAPQVSPDGSWMMARDRTRAITLVELAADRRWNLGPARNAHWTWLAP